MRFILGIALINGSVAHVQFSTSGSHIRLFDTRKTIIFIGRAPSGCVENACNNAILRDNYWPYCCAKLLALLLCFNCKIIFSLIETKI